MARIFGTELTKAALLARVGSMEAIAGVRRVMLEDGRSRGMQAYEVVCGRLRFSVLIDKCMDIAELYYDGMPLHFVSRPGSMRASNASPSRMMDFIASGATGNSIVDAFAETIRRSICAVMHNGRPLTVGMDSNTPTPRWMIRSETGSVVSFSGRNAPSI